MKGKEHDAYMLGGIETSPSENGDITLSYSKLRTPSCSTFLGRATESTPLTVSVETPVGVTNSSSMNISACPYVNSGALNHSAGPSDEGVDLRTEILVSETVGEIINEVCVHQFPESVVAVNLDYVREIDFSGGQNHLNNANAIESWKILKNI